MILPRLLNRRPPSTMARSVALRGRGRLIQPAAAQLHHHHWLSTSPKVVSSTELFAASSTLSAASAHTQPEAVKRGLTIGILRESYDDWERRTPLCPSHVQQMLLNKNYSAPNSILVQPSSQRCFSNADYERAGAVLSEDLSEAEIILGVKRPADPDTLLNNKTYVFFSHVIKGQGDNMGLLQTILDKQVQLVDYECIVEPQPVGKGASSKTAQRLVAFGKYAGLAGMIDSFFPLGRRLVSDYGVHTPFLQCPLASMQRDLAHAKDTIREIGEQIAHDGLPPILVNHENENGQLEQRNEPLVFCLTGQGGRVFGGAMEIMDLLPHERIHAQDLPELFAQSNPDPYRVYTVTPSPEDMYQRCSDGSFHAEDWRNHPTEYDSRFATEIAPYIHVLVNCIYWDPRYARLLTKDDAQRLHEEGLTRYVTRVFLLRHFLKPSH